MKKVLLLIGISALMLQASAAINAYSVTTCWKHGCPNWTPYAAEGLLPAGCDQHLSAGSIVRYDIDINPAIPQVVNVDTIVSKSVVLCQYPAINICGNKVAFFKWGQRVNGNALQSLSSGNQIAIVDIDGNNLKDIVAIPSTIGIENALDWPADGWIYYSKPRTDNQADNYGRSGYEIWKVNPYAVNPASTNQLVVAISNTLYVRRFSLNQAGTIMGLQAYCYPGVACSGEVNHAATFPGNVDMGGVGGCNDKVSASGTYIGGYSGAKHDFVVFGRNNGSRFPDFPSDQTARNTFQTTVTSLYVNLNWTDFQMKTGTSNSDCNCEQLCWSSNSDKWYCQNVAWHDGNGMRLGMNQIVTNWVDKKAIVPTKNGQVTFNPGTEDPASAASMSFVGDFWVAPPAGASYNYSYQDSAGSWHQMANPQSVSTVNPLESTLTRPGSGTGAINSQQMHGNANYSAAYQNSQFVLKNAGVGTLTILNINGRALFSKHFKNQISIDTRTMPIGVYVAQVTLQGTRVTESFSVSR